ncbi:30S ribosomal protein S12 methylthiotransferase RimO [candidate division GN15 bacterium]|nr:30S ribosomal protein S12 methylthiotransferase RimO [candidate division GN15 bacterium]
MDKPVRREARQLGYLTWKDRFLTDSLPYSYLKISDGCDRMCTYCAIPSMRGHFRSRPLDSIIREAEFLASSGKKELILVSQEATMWGYDLPGEPQVISLLEELDEVDGIEWIRLMYLHPAKMDEALVEYMASNNKTLNYFDLPLQHVSTPVLEAMRRQIDRPQTETVLNMIRSRSNNNTLRTTFIVGFPGETGEQFEELLEAVETYRFDRLGVFPYSPEEGTPAEQMPDQIDDDTKRERMDLIMSLQQEIAFERNLSMVGQRMQVLIDSVDSKGQAIGRTEADCPEIDQEVYVSGENLRVGDLVEVTISAAEGYDLRGSTLNQD